MKNDSAVRSMITPWWWYAKNLAFANDKKYGGLIAIRRCFQNCQTKQRKFSSYPNGNVEIQDNLKEVIQNNRVFEHKWWPVFHPLLTFSSYKNQICDDNCCYGPYGLDKKKIRNSFIWKFNFFT